MESISNFGKKSWFALKVVSGAEASIMHQIKLNYEAANIQDCFESLYSPSVEIKTGKRVREKTLYPGYIFIKMSMTDGAKDAVLSVPKVYSFLSDGSGKPKAISESEYNKMTNKISEMHQSNIEGQTFAIGDVIKIKSGSFNEFKGTVLAVDKEKKLLTLSILVFQRETRVVIAFDDAEKIN
jgi:transcription termination/antitermination protein NusG